MSRVLSAYTSDLVLYDRPPKIDHLPYCECGHYYEQHTGNGCEAVCRPACTCTLTGEPA